jgi:hypothetical protein
VLRERGLISISALGIGGAIVALALALTGGRHGGEAGAAISHLACPQHAPGYRAEQLPNRNRAAREILVPHDSRAVLLCRYFGLDAGAGNTRILRAPRCWPAPAS